MNPYRKNQRLVIGLVLAAVAAYFIFWWMPHRRRMAQLQEQVRSVQQTIRAETARMERMGELRAELAELQRYVGEIESQLPEQLELARFLSHLYALAKELGVEIVQTQPQVPSRLIDLQIQAIHLTLTGTSPAISRLIYGLETSPRLIELTALELRTGSRKRPGLVEAQIESRLFARRTAESERSDKATAPEAETPANDSAPARALNTASRLRRPGSLAKLARN